MTTRPVRRTVSFIVGTLAACAGLGFVIQQKREGYKDTPFLPGQKWRVHDVDRPYPHEVTPGAVLGAPPSDAEVLLDGTNLSHWTQTDTEANDSNLKPAKWNLVDGEMEVNPGSGDLFSREKYGDCQIHIEWREPVGIEGFGQGRGNSGMFIQNRYELQVLDSYRAPTYADGQAGSIYGQWPPLVNPMRKPGEWQTYDVIFQAPKFEGDKVVEPAYITLFFNGVMVQNHQKLNGPTNHAVITPYSPYVGDMPIRLQDHSSTRKVRYRNIWVRRLKDYDQPEK